MWWEVTRSLKPGTTLPCFVCAGGMTMRGRSVQFVSWPQTSAFAVYLHVFFAVQLPKLPSLLYFCHWQGNPCAKLPLGGSPAVFASIDFTQSILTSHLCLAVFFPLRPCHTLRIPHFPIWRTSSTFCFLSFIWHAYSTQIDCRRPSRQRDWTSLYLGHFCWPCTHLFFQNSWIHVLVFWSLTLPIWRFPFQWLARWWRCIYFPLSMSFLHWTSIPIFFRLLL